MYELVKKIYAENEENYYYIGLRFENKNREIGEECEWSKSNVDREDERDFPEYGTPEYDEMESMGGTSAWNLSAMTDYYWPGFGRPPRDIDVSKDCTRYFLADHCYIIAGNRKAPEHQPWDDGEIVISDAVVIAKIF